MSKASSEVVDAGKVKLPKLERQLTVQMEQMEQLRAL
ncbi:hypothetical protein I6E86_07200 [Psychrobacter sp. SWN149]|nr:hypothetical protein [Psychrobacter sp. SWN149]